MKKRFFGVFGILFLFLVTGITSHSAAKDNEVVLYIVRHGKTMLNTTDRVQGWSDAVLTPAGIEVAEYLGAGLKEKKIKFTAAYSSDSGRSIQTADIVLKETGQKSIPLKTDWRLREFNFGTYEGDLNHTMWTDIAKSQGKTLEQWQAAGISPKDFANSVAALDKGRDPEGVNWPAEDYETITKRLKEGIDEIAKESARKGGGNVLVVSHGLSITALVNTLDPGLNVPAGLKNASVTKVVYKNGKYEVKEVGDMSFVEIGRKLNSK